MLFSDLLTNAVSEESVAESTVLTSDEAAEEIAANQESTDDDDSASVSWTILLSVIGGLFFFVLTLMLIFICFRWRMDNREKIFEGPTVAQNGLPLNLCFHKKNLRKKKAHNRFWTYRN